MIARGSECARQRDALAALAERREPSPAGQAALEHVERCRDCSVALGELILTVFALRRLGSEAAAVTEPVASEPDDAWTRLRFRIDRSRRLAQEQAWRWRATLGGLVATSLLVAVVVGPATVTSRTDVAGEVGSGGSSLALERLEQQVELATLRAERRTFNPMVAVDGEPSGTVAGGTTYPDVIRPMWKEVQPAEHDVGIPKPQRVVPAI
jgi:hypothetical protein